jgi:hypothetical protein
LDFRLTILDYSKSFTQSKIPNPKSKITSPDHARPYKTVDILRYVLRPSMFPLERHVFRRLAARIPNMSAQTGRQAAKKAT